MINNIDENEFEDFLDNELPMPGDLNTKSNTMVISETNEEKQKQEKKKETPKLDIGDSKLFVVRTTANREDQVFEFLESNINQKKIPIYSIFRAHGMRGYVFIEGRDILDAQRAVYGVPYARGLLSSTVSFEEVDNMLDTGKSEINVKKNDIVEIISGPFKRENAKITRIDKQKEEVVVELLEAAVSIPITLKFDAVKVIRREDSDDEE